MLIRVVKVNTTFEKSTVSKRCKLVLMITEKTSFPQGNQPQSGSSSTCIHPSLVFPQNPIYFPIMKTPGYPLYLSLLFAALLFPSHMNLIAGNWPSWRGDIAGSGISQEGKLPVEWDKEKNVIWRIDLPDRGNSTPAIWGEKIFLPQAVEDKGYRGVKCLDKKDGTLLWEKGVTYNVKERYPNR